MARNNWFALAKQICDSSIQEEPLEGRRRGWHYCGMEDHEDHLTQDADGYWLCEICEREMP